MAVKVRDWEASLGLGQAGYVPSLSSLVLCVCVCRGAGILSLHPCLLLPPCVTAFCNSQLPITCLDSSCARCDSAAMPRAKPSDLSRQEAKT